ncbi:MAG: PRC-barrel domain-containing protein [Crenarchaeota archaeon]|nr:PRC-barrel domain-containing protein [Thermoproteota archaeon]
MLIRKDKIIGLQVYDKRGRYVGTVKDIGFVLGENLVGIVVVGRDNREMEFIWSEVDAAEDIVILKKEVTVPAVPPVSAKPAVETREEPKAQVKEQVSTKPPAYVPKEPEVQVASSSSAAAVPEAQPSFKEPAEFEEPELEHVETVTPTPRPAQEEAGGAGTKTCPKCGAINNARYKFCFRCGTRLPT